MFIVPRERSETVCSTIISHFDQIVQTLFDEDIKQQGYYLALTVRAKRSRCPFWGSLSPSCQWTPLPSPMPHGFRSAAELKKLAKGKMGAVWWWTGGQVRRNLTRCNISMKVLEGVVKMYKTIAVSVALFALLFVAGCGSSQAHRRHQRFDGYRNRADHLELTASSGASNYVIFRGTASGAITTKTPSDSRCQWNEFQ